MLLKGIAVSPGLAVARCLMVREPVVAEAPRTNLNDREAAIETECLHAALRQSVEALQAKHDKALAKGDETGAEVLDAHIMLLSDPSFTERVEQIIAGERIDAISATRKGTTEMASLFESMEDAYFRERAQDIRDIGRRVEHELAGVEEQDLSDLPEDLLLVGHNITPSMMASADKRHVAGIVSEVGGKTCHTAILARNLDIPAVFGSLDVEAHLADGMLAAVNGTEGTVLTELTHEKEEVLRADIRRMARQREALRDMILAESATRDGVHVEIAANLMNAEDAPRVLEYGADGIGLYRTEFLYMDRNTPPGEEEQYRAYRKVLTVLGDRPVIIRTLDIGGDKEVPYLNLPKEENPFIGYRAIRICLDDTALFKNQLRAILRASAHGKARIMFPMIACVEEFRQAKALVRECMEELDQRGQAYDRTIPIGLMVEIPSAAIMADRLITEADFMSIGTNDLTQYTLAADRMNERVAALYNPFRPGVLRMIRLVTEAARAEKSLRTDGGSKFAGMCGEMAGDPMATLLLLGLGLTEFSVNPSSVMRIRKLISLVTLAEAETIARTAMTFDTAEEVEAWLKAETVRIAGDWL